MTDEIAEAIFMRSELNCGNIKASLKKVPRKLKGKYKEARINSKLHENYQQAQRELGGSPIEA